MKIERLPCTNDHLNYPALVLGYVSDWSEVELVFT